MSNDDNGNGRRAAETWRDFIDRRFSDVWREMRSIEGRGKEALGDAERRQDSARRDLRDEFHDLKGKVDRNNDLLIGVNVRTGLISALVGTLIAIANAIALWLMRAK